LESTVSYRNQADVSSEFAKRILVLGLVDENPIKNISKNNKAFFFGKNFFNFFDFGKF
tara:strand:+ start:244 stop:417 length:174 start_codon:yes stop_codon:yes gene_type:complete